MAQCWAKTFYNSKKWQKCRAYIMARDYHLCQCHKILGGEPCGEPAFDVHHIIELTPENITDPLISLSENNLIAVNDIHHREWIHRVSHDCTPGYYFDDNGQVIPINNL